VRTLTPEERIALVEVGPPGEGPIPDEVFAELERLGWGYWADGLWYVTAAGRAALEYDTLARANGRLSVETAS